MDWRILFYILLLLALPLITISPILYKLLISFKKTKGEYVTIQIGKSAIISSKKTIIRSFYILIAVYFIGDFIPLIPFSGLIIAFIILSVVSQKMKISSDLKISSNNSLLEHLKESLKTIQTSISHIESLSVELESKKSELITKENDSIQLEEKISKQLEEYNELKNVTEKDKKQVIHLFKKAVSTRNPINILGVIIGSILLNIIASVLWSLAGNPTKEQMIEYIKSFFHK
jgi:hypothetical protein